MQICTGRQLSRCVLAVCLALWTAPTYADPVLKHEGTLIWKQTEPWFGGWSGAEVNQGGSSVLIVSDKGRILRATMVRSDGLLTGLADIRSTNLLSPLGKIIKGKRQDAEGLAVNSKGQVFVSFEHGHRVMQVDPTSGRTSGLIRLPDGMPLQPNSGVEALAVGPNETIYAIPERSGGRAQPFPLYAYSDTRWRIAAQLPRRGSFLPVGADIDASGRLWLLERTVSPLGFRSRIRVFEPDETGLRETTLLTTAPGQFDNLEALSVWQNSQGQTRLTLISDDNFLSIQQTQIVEFLLME